jgi:hypothetical protein
MLTIGIRSTLAVVAAVVILLVPAAGDARGSGASPPQGRGPGSGYDYRRNRDAPGLGYPRSEAQARPPRTVPAPAWGDPEYRLRRERTTGYPPPRHGQGVGRPGWRSQGPSAYPRHRQYGNPPGVPPAPGSER